MSNFQVGCKTFLKPIKIPPMGRPLTATCVAKVQLKLKLESLDEKIKVSKSDFIQVSVKQKTSTVFKKSKKAVALFNLEISPWIFHPQILSKIIGTSVI